MIPLPAGPGPGLELEPEPPAELLEEEAEEDLEEEEEEEGGFEGDFTSVPAQTAGSTQVIEPCGQAKGAPPKKPAVKKPKKSKKPKKGAPPPKLTSKTVAPAPGPRTRTTIGVGEEVTLTHSPGSVAWSTTGGTLSAAAGKAATLTAPDTAQTVTVTGGTLTLAFTVIAPSGVHMDRYLHTKIKHTKDRPDSGIQTQFYLLPDTVNFYNVQFHEVDVGAVCSGVYTPFNGVGHDPAPATLTLSKTVVKGKGTKANAMDEVYSGDPGTAPPFTPGSIVYSIPYEYKVGGAFANFATVAQTSSLTAPDALESNKAGASGKTTVGAATSTY
jgi:hypothetical protein